MLTLAAALSLAGCSGTAATFNRVDWVEVMDMRHASITQRAVRQ